MSDKLDDLLLLEKLAAGGMAEVYRAIQQGYGGFEKVVAVKRILPHFASDEDFKNMFVMEANLSGLFMHPNIVQIYSNGEAEGYLYLVMEFVDGRNVRQLLARCDKAKTRIPIEYSCFIVAEAAKGLDYAHTFVDQKTGQDMEIVHRDMSPQNVMLSYDGSVKIVDFGIAKAAARSENTRAGVLKGKFGYMSPEQANGMPIDRRTDIFALGIIFFELITQRRLFSHDDDMRTLQLIRECNVPRPSKYNPAVSPALDRIVLKALAKNRNERYQTAGEFFGDLHRFMNQKYPNFLPTDFAKFLKEKAFLSDIAKDRAKREALAADAPARLGKPKVAKISVKGVHNKHAPVDKDATQFDFSEDDGEATIVPQSQPKGGHKKSKEKTITKIENVSAHFGEDSKDSDEKTNVGFLDAKTRITDTDAGNSNSLPEPQKLELTNNDEEEPILDSPQDMKLSVVQEPLVQDSNDGPKKNQKDLTNNSAFPAATGPSHLSLSMTMTENDRASEKIPARKIDNIGIKSKPKAPLRSSSIVAGGGGRRLDLEDPRVNNSMPLQQMSSSPPTRSKITGVDRESSTTILQSPLFLFVMILAGAGAYMRYSENTKPVGKEIVQIPDNPPPSKNNKDPELRERGGRTPAQVQLDAPPYSPEGATGYLNIISFPNATAIYVDGKILVSSNGEVVRSPANLQKIDVGRQNIRIVNRALDMSWEGTVDISFDSVKKLEVRLQ